MIQPPRAPEPAALLGDQIPRRVVSLVPSYTESLFDLGFGETVVGVSDYCTRPAGAVAHLPRVGGPKNARVDEIVRLKPDLVIANREENDRQAVEALQQAGIPVWVCFPWTVDDALEDLYQITRLFRSDQALLQVQMIERGVEWARLSAVDEPVRYFCPIWQDRLETGTPWWMTFNRQTYSSDLLALVGGENVFATRDRRYPFPAEFGMLPAEDPGERDTRYPRVSREEILAARPEVILLPDEPYAYSRDDSEAFAQQLAGTPAAQREQIVAIDGSLISWYGTRLAAALQELPAVFLR